MRYTFPHNNNVQQIKLKLFESDFERNILTFRMTSLFNHSLYDVSVIDKLYNLQQGKQKSGSGKSGIHGFDINESLNVKVI